ncbi:MAG TPA: thioredoxin family protein [Polyangia bacterium]|jgi:thioredoxin 1
MPQLSPEALDEALHGRRVMALFHATWCPYCRTFAPVFRQAAAPAGYAPLEIVIDDDDDPLWERYAIQLVPTVLFFEEGKVIQRLDGRPGVGLTEPLLRQAIAGRAG